MNVQLQKGDKLTKFAASYVSEATDKAINLMANSQYNGSRSACLRAAINKHVMPRRRLRRA